MNDTEKKKLCVLIGLLFTKSHIQGKVCNALMRFSYMACN